jgi:RNA polymerase sigma-70 factor (ECF subfamily)
MAGHVDAPDVSLEALLVSFQPQVRRHILSMVRNEAEADELTQESYARALERKHQLRDPQAALAWLYRIATTVSLNRLRQRRPSPVPLDDANVAAEESFDRERAPSPLEGALEQSEMSECVQRYLATLPDDYRIAILLHDANGLSNAEIAELVGCSLATAKIRVHRARHRLGETLKAACSFEIDDRGVLVCNPQPGSEMTSPESARVTIATRRQQKHPPSTPGLDRHRRTCAPG